MLNQRQAAAVDGLFQPVGQFVFQAEAEYRVEVSNHGPDGFVIVDAVQLIPLDNPPSEDARRPDVNNRHRENES